ncbi:MAG: hypothetical protein ACRCZB_04935 [Bacteroidales bacterium]
MTKQTGTRLPAVTRPELEKIIDEKIDSRLLPAKETVLDFVYKTRPIPDLNSQKDTVKFLMENGVERNSVLIFRVFLLGNRFYRENKKDFDSVIIEKYHSVKYFGGKNNKGIIQVKDTNIFIQNGEILPFFDESMYLCKIIIVLFCSQLLSILQEKEAEYSANEKVQNVENRYCKVLADKFVKKVSRNKFENVIFKNKRCKEYSFKVGIYDYAIAKYINVVLLFFKKNREKIIKEFLSIDGIDVIDFEVEKFVDMFAHEHGGHEMDILRIKVYTLSTS